MEINKPQLFQSIFMIKTSLIDQNVLEFTFYIEVIKILTLCRLAPPGFKVEMGEQKKIEFLTSIYISLLIHRLFRFFLYK